MIDSAGKNIFYFRNRGRNNNGTAAGPLALMQPPKEVSVWSVACFCAPMLSVAWGLARSMSYPDLAGWLTIQGYPTKADDLKNAKRAKLLGSVVPATPQVLMLLDILILQFPGLDGRQFLVAENVAIAA